jgi:hypothetical protein
LKSVFAKNCARVSACSKDDSYFERFHHRDAEYSEFGVFFDQKLLTLRPPRSSEKIQSQKSKILPERNQVLATADFCEKGFFLTTRASAVNTLKTLLF